MDIASKLAAVIAAAELEGKSFVDVTINFTSDKPERHPGNFLASLEKALSVDIARNDSRQPDQIVAAIETHLAKKMREFPQQKLEGLYNYNHQYERSKTMSGQPDVAAAMAHYVHKLGQPDVAAAMAQHVHQLSGMGGNMHFGTIGPTLNQQMGQLGPVMVPPGPPMVSPPSDGIRPRSPTKRKTATEKAIEVIDNVLNKPRRKK